MTHPESAPISASPAHRAHSGPMLDGPDRAASRAMLYAVGFEKGDFQKSQVGIASTWSQVTPCNVHIDGLAREAAAEGADAAGGKSGHLQHHHRLRRHLHGHRRA